MSTPTFAKTHNLIAYSAKPTKSEGFKQIIDFLNGSSVSYALTTSPTICTPCIMQFWTTAKVKTINDEVKIQALINEKRVNIKESSIRRTLKLDDAEGTSCLANAKIFDGLAKIVKNIEEGVPFFMFPMFMQLLIDHQLGDMSYHKDIYDNPSLTKNVFANIKRVGTCFSGVVTLLFDNMLVPAAKEVGLIQNDVQSISILTEPSTSKPHKKHKPKKQQTQAPKVPSPEPSPEHMLPSPSNDPLPGGNDSLKLKELMDLYTHLSKKVLELESEVIDIKSNYIERIEKLEGRVDKLEEENMVLKELHSMDIGTITRKEPKLDKNEHENGKITNSYFPNNSSVTIPRRRNKRRAPNVVELELRTIIEVAPIADNRRMKELLQAPTEGYGEVIVIPEINVDHFEIKTNFLELVQANSYHGFERENPHTHINNFKRITLTLKFMDVPNDVIKLMMFPYSLEGAARVWYNKEPPNTILTWEDLVNKFVNQFFPPSKTTYLKNEIFRFTQRFEETFGEAWERFKEILRAFPNNQVQQGFSNEFSSYKKANDQMMRNMQSQINSLKGEFKNEFQNSMKTQQTVLMEEQNVFQKMLSGFFQNQASTSGTLPSNTIPNPKGEMKAITTRSGVAYERPLIPTPNKVVERETEETTDKDQINFQGSTTHIQLPIAPIPESDVLKTLPMPNIPYPSRLNNQNICEKATKQMEKFFQIFQDLHFDISFLDALLLMPKFAYTIKSLLANKDKEEYVQEMLGFSKNSLSGNPTSTSEPIISDSSPSLTPFEGSDFILEEIKAYLKDESISPKIDHVDCDPEGDICLIAKLLNDDMFQLPPMDLKQGDVARAKSSIEEPLELELKDSPSHLEYAYLGGADKLPVIIAKVKR
nr:reverse transcriptase domain-containing protein [Tanacetum cinerariifolium]